MADPSSFDTDSSAPIQGFSFRNYLMSAQLNQLQASIIMAVLQNQNDDADWMVQLLHADSYTNRFSVLERYTASLAAAGFSDGDMDVAAQWMLGQAIVTLRRYGHLQLAQDLLVAVAPPDLQYVQEWLQYFENLVPIVHPHRASNYAAQQTRPANSLIQDEGEATDPSPEPAFTSAPVTSESSQAAHLQISDFLTPTAPAASEQATQDMAPNRPTARQALNKKGPAKKKQQQQQQKKKKAKPNRFTSQQLKRVGPTTAAAGFRWICPFHVSRPGITTRCKNVFGKRNDLVRHVKRAHFAGKSGWGSDPSHFQDCGPYSEAHLRSLGVVTKLRARRKANETAADLTATVSGSGSEDEDDGSEGYLSDGDSGPDQGPPQGRKDDGNDGHGHGHGLAQPIAVA